MPITALDLLARFGAKDIAEVAVPQELLPLTGTEMTQAAQGADLSDWEPDARQSAAQALARIDMACRRARTELAFYLRYRPTDTATPEWLTDDTAELVRYHLYDKAGNAESTVRLRYQDVIKRLKALMDEDAANGASDRGGESSVKFTSHSRVFSRRTLRGL